MDTFSFFYGKQVYEKWFALFLLSLFATSFLGLSNAIVWRIPVIGETLGPIINTIIQYVSLIGSLRYIKKKIRYLDCLFYIIILGIYGSQYIIHPENRLYLDDFFLRSMVFAIPFYFVGLAWDIRSFDKLFFSISIAGILWMFVYQLFINDKTLAAMDEGLHQMTEAYETLFLILYATWYTFRNFSVVGLISIFLGVLCLFAFGTRGPLVVYLLFVFIYTLFFSKFRYKKIVLLLFAVLSILFFIYFEPVMIGLDVFLSSMGYNTRITQQILQDNIQDASADERLYIIDILRGKLSGVSSSFGIFGSWQFVDTYSHRIYWDFWFSFGYIIGSILMGVFAFIHAKSFIKTDPFERGFWLLLFCDAIITLFISDYFMFRGSFWLFLGYSIQIIRK